MKRIIINAVLIFYIIILFNSCYRNNNIDYLFGKLINMKNKETFYSINLHGIENVNNKYYKKLYSIGKNLNPYLLNKCYSTKLTNWYFDSFYFQMTEGDIAIQLLIEINFDDYTFIKIIPEEIYNEYIENGKNSNIWWIYLHKNSNNRKEIIELISNNIEEK
jgi:hypothetical protein